MKTYKKLFLFSALPLLLLIWAACGTYGAADFDEGQAMGIFAGTSTFEVVEDAFPMDKAQRKVEKRTVMSCGYMDVYHETLSLPKRGVKFIGPEVDPKFAAMDENGRVIDSETVIQSIELNEKFKGWGPQFITIGLSSMEEVQEVMGDKHVNFDNSLTYFDTGMKFEFKKNWKSGEMVLSKVIIS